MIDTFFQETRNAEGHSLQLECFDKISGSQQFQIRPADSSWRDGGRYPSPSATLLGLHPGSSSTSLLFPVCGFVRRENRLWKWMMAQDLWNAKRLHPDAALKRTNQFRLKEEGGIVSQDPEVRVKHKTCSTECGTPVQVIWPKFMTELASGSKKVIMWPRMGLAYQNLERKWTPMTFSGGGGVESKNNLYNALYWPSIVNFFSFHFLHPCVELQGSNRDSDLARITNDKIAHFHKGSSLVKITLQWDGWRKFPK